MRLEVCPHCGKIGTLHRSRSRNFYERAVKFLLPYKIYRCSDCGWRGFRYIGWVEKLFGKTERRRKIAKWEVYFFLFFVFVLLVLAYFYFEKIGTALAPIVKEMLQK
ncbi:hypothetical protein JGI7_01422 [Candidatus Kryptonium thompsonii]|uniref:Uncharacterized protein n=1 Tax=Candidatus Kryptonium thompsonii TaxID=1633631 RepID=A0A0P1LFA2_9BACT|nr:hypothetical protein [Candidatus Kryptonium thompsoni]CUS77634.1 hypothetical protein JGI6_00497 [Candidatus Kryptonium thompsoni]CUS78025.1 hypothetical protein JGI12_00161 [Candidatus Kryptonium thompsoni]CUS86443.1 hypothetical protein JGI10_01249 [Candidatus Kryptonium thompsoni]CUS89869.1 hypothetical protein JGI13_01764 [Candidatus Kryptonium thompsoni]CUS90385.1 hypothetical protein JGI7_01422 [Candidatus Kryptonium thompsoni]